MEQTEGSEKMPVKRLLKKVFQRKRSDTEKEQKSSSPRQLHSRLEHNLREIGEQLGNSSDINVRRLRTGLSGEIDAALIYTDGLADDKSVNHLAEANLCLGEKSQSGRLHAADGGSNRHYLVYYHLF